MNNSPISHPPVVFDDMQQACIDVLTDALEEAMKGRISSLALIVCMEDGIAPVMAGKNAGGLALGCLHLLREIDDEIFQKGNLASGKRKSNILRVR
jgi:hypothetical protein